MIIYQQHTFLNRHMLKDTEVELKLRSDNTNKANIASE